MLNNIKTLLIADIKRLAKYNILQISTGLAVIYAVLIYFSSPEEALLLVPLLVFVDVTMMSIIMLGASLFFEKQEGSLKSVMVSPITLKEVIIVKTLSAVALSLITVTILSAVAIIAHGLSINVLLMMLYALLGASVHIMIGFALVIISKDFNTLLINYVIYVLLFTLPAIFVLTGLIPESLIYVLYISPSFATQVLLNTSIGSSATVFEILFCISYLIVLTVGLFKGFVYKNFKNYIIKG